MAQWQFDTRVKAIAVLLNFTCLFCACVAQCRPFSITQPYGNTPFLRYAEAQNWAAQDERVHHAEGAELKNLH